MTENKSLISYLFAEPKVEIKQPSQYLSFYELMKVDGFSSSIMKDDTTTFRRILWENGCDIDKPFKLVKCVHRPRTSNEPYEGFKIDYSERVDKEWIDSGAASLNAYAYSAKKGDLVSELLNLDPNNQKKYYYEDAGLEDE